jgi:hypothetical protein
MHLLVFRSKNLVIIPPGDVWCKQGNWEAALEVLFQLFNSYLSFFLKNTFVCFLPIADIDFYFVFLCQQF